MKYTILGFQQRTLIKLGLDLKDAILLRYFIDFRDTTKMRKEIIDDEVYYWVKYKAIIEEYPILGIKQKDGIYRRLQKLVDANVLKHTTVKTNGIYSYYTTDVRYLELISDSELDVSDEKPIVSDEKSEGIGSKVGRVSDEKSEGIGSKVGTNNPSTIYPSTIYNPSTIISSSEEIEEDIVANIKSKIKERGYSLKKKEILTLVELYGIIKTFKAIEASLSVNSDIGNFYGYVNSVLKDMETQKIVNVQKEKPKDNFNNFEQRKYDMDSLERKLLGWDK